MSCENYLTLKGVEHISKELESQNILYGIIDFFNWSTLQVGNFQNVYRPTTTVYGGDKSRLRPVVDPRFTNGQVWEAFRGNWVWETGFPYDVSPIRVSGVYVNGSFYEPDDATYAHSIDYRRGRIIFDTPISTSFTIQAEYSPRLFSFVDADTPFVKQMLYEPYRVDKADFLSSASGAWNPLSDVRAELPIIAVSVSPNGTFRPYQIGGGQWEYFDAYFYVFAENRFWRDQISDMIARQNDRAFWTINRGLLKASNQYPPDLDYAGTLVDTPIEYPDLVAPTGDGGFRWKGIRFTKTSKQFTDMEISRLYEGIIKTSIEIILHEI